MKTMKKTPAGVVASAIMCWAPLVALLLTVFLWQDPAANVPSHWTFGAVADSFTTSTAAFLWSLLPAVVGGVGATVFLILIGRESRPRRMVLGFAITAAAAGLLSLQWVLGQATAVSGDGNMISYSFLLALAPIAWGLLVLAIGSVTTAKAAAFMREKPDPNEGT
jgi:hypothetical protein